GERAGFLDFGFWILDFGLQTGFLDFGFWILDFGFGWVPRPTIQNPKPKICNVNEVGDAPDYLCPTAAGPGGLWLCLRR
ncbi:MAG: hypothetical protein WCK70_15600, partial [Chloroflexales bacterium]